MFLNIDLVGHNKITLVFQILDTPLAQLWVERMNARGNYTLDHPDRFYGFNSQEVEIQQAESYITKQIDAINAYQPLIDRPFTNYADQDCLNYLHSVFERFHGLLDEQDTVFWNQAPDAVRTALAQLNLAVHRCELVARGPTPRFTCTWYGMPKTLHIPREYMLQYGTLYNEFGTVYLNYCEIGKTLEDLTTDRDRYISEDAFRPYDFYSADFVVKFWTDSEHKVQQELKDMREYYNKHRDFFRRQGFDQFEDPRLQPLRFPVARLVETMPRDQLLEEIKQRQYVSKVYIQ